MDAESALNAWLNSSFSREATGSYDDCKLGPLQTVLARLPKAPEPVTVAGTKGKGSCLRFLEMALLEAGEHCLCFTSPHVRSICERWRLDGAPLASDLAWAAARQVETAEHDGGQQLTYFERCFAIAVIMAAKHGGFFLCEVGLGGRLDCANALNARVAILTHIGFDHCYLLGNTLAAIAAEKCAIARPGRPFLVATQSALRPDELQAAMPDGCEASMVDEAMLPPGISLGLPGEHQRGNAAAALAAFRILLPQVDDAVALRGFAKARLAARCQVIETHGRRVLIDAAHHDESIAATLREAERQLRPGWLIVLGLARDKEIARIQAVLPEATRIHRCGFHWPRALDETGWPPALASCPWHAHVGHALADIPAERDLCIVGSFYLAGEALALLAPDDALPG